MISGMPERRPSASLRLCRALSLLTCVPPFSWHSTGVGAARRSSSRLGAVSGSVSSRPARRPHAACPRFGCGPASASTHTVAGHPSRAAPSPSVTGCRGRGAGSRVTPVPVFGVERPGVSGRQAQLCRRKQAGPRARVLPSPTGGGAHPRL